MKRLSLVQERIDLLAERDPLETKVDIIALKIEFIEYAWYYSQSMGITRAAWPAAGVPANFLTAAGL